MAGYDHLAKAIRDIPDFPKKGILFKDITTLIKQADLFAEVIDIFTEKYREAGIDKVVGIEARGYLFASALAYRLGAGLIPVRQPGKLPAKTVRVTYQLEYGSDSVEMHRDAVASGEKVLVVDDLLATGGTAEATCTLVRGQGAQIAGVAFVVELEFLHGRRRLEGDDVFAIVKF